jgi:L,D-peptidoglycan transpeptidase YkuD (ErfK/YbiS/YcfS/YnhG family)
MKREDDLYRWGIVVEHNPENTPEKGSCIFLHLWRDAQHGTAGCTAMSADHMESLLRWLSDDKEPHLVQLPDPAYTRLQHGWDLP